MKEELIQLVTLQKFDTQILEIDDHLIGLKKEIETADARLDKAREQVGEKEDNLQQLQLESKKAEGEIEEAETRYKGYSYQLMSMKDEKSYESMKLQMEDLRSSIEERENKGIDVLNSIEQTEKTLTMYGEKISAEEERVDGLRAKLQEQTDSRADERSELVKKREGYINGISPALMAKYERLLNLPDHCAIAEVNMSNRTCLKCYSTVTRENAETIKMMKDVVNCNRCGRILYVPALLGQADPE
jgi:predicted  nucleic acid-binding Zn-ribbon protein